MGPLAADDVGAVDVEAGLGRVHAPRAREARRAGSGRVRKRRLAQVEPYRAAFDGDGWVDMETAEMILAENC